MRFWTVGFAAVFLLAGCAQNKQSVFFSDDLPEPLKPHPKALTAGLPNEPYPADLNEWRIA